MGMFLIKCEPFPNTSYSAWTRRLTSGEFRGYVRSIERGAWLTPCVNTWKSGADFRDRRDAMEAATNAAREAARTGYVPAF